MAELAARAEVPVATVKYYLREGLLPAGRAAGPRRAEYDESHVRRLHLLWLLREVGGVPVSALREIITAVEAGNQATPDRLTRIADALTPELTPGDPGSSEPDEPSLAVVDGLMAGAGWTGVRPEAAARRRLARLLQLLGDQTRPLSIQPADLRRYVQLADELSRIEVAMVDAEKDHIGTLEDMVTGEVVFGEVFALLRRLAHEHLHTVGIRPGVDD